MSGEREREPAYHNAMYIFRLLELHFSFSLDNITNHPVDKKDYRLTPVSLPSLPFLFSLPPFPPIFVSSNIYFILGAIIYVRDVVPFVSYVWEYWINFLIFSLHICVCAKSSFIYVLPTKNLQFAVFYLFVRVVYFVIFFFHFFPHLCFIHSFRYLSVCLPEATFIVVWIN